MSCSVVVQVDILMTIGRAQIWQRSLYTESIYSINLSMMNLEPYRVLLISLCRISKQNLMSDLNSKLLFYNCKKNYPSET